MKLTLVFSSHESIDISVGMVFVPCATWIQGRKYLLAPNPKNPHYELGYLRKLLELPAMASQLQMLNRGLVLVVHPNGHGSADDLDRVLLDCEREGFFVERINLQYAASGLNGPSLR